MKIRVWGIWLIFIAAILNLLVPGPAFCEEKAEDNQSLWKKANEAQNNGLPQTAIENLAKIYKNAMAEKKHSEALKAICKQISLESTIKGNKPEEKIKRLADEIKNADESMKPLMKTILAEWYWHYFTRNKYRFMNRTQTAGLNESDFTTWDLPKLFKTISTLFNEVLTKDEEVLKKTQISDFKDILEGGDAQSDRLRPTLYDFIAFQALDFYTSGEQAAALPQDAFEIKADSDAFAPAEKFMKYKIETSDTESAKVLALNFYQKLMSFHAADSDKDIFIAADLFRLKYVKNEATGADKDDIYIKRLQEIINEYPKSEFADLATFYWAQEIQNKGDLVEAVKIAEKAAGDGKKYTIGSSNCRALINNIKQKAISLKSERTALINTKSKLTVSYKNIDSVTVRIYRDDWGRYIENTENSFEWFNDEQLYAFIGKKHEIEWTVPLEPTKDYKERNIQIDVPELKAGLYRVIASYKKDFSRNENTVQHCPLWVNNISLIVRNRDNGTEGYVLDSLNGVPVKAATLKAYYVRDYKIRRYEVLSTVTTDENGYFLFKKNSKTERHNGFIIYASDNKGGEFIDWNNNYSGERYNEPVRQQTFFFTDRAIYRPGQTINFKGICISADTDKKNYEVLKNHYVTVHYRDVNYQEIASAKFKTNDFGSFSGTFTAPSGRLMGAMTISSEFPSGSCTIRVEEYKRPKFTVEVKIPEESYRLNDKVKIMGEAMAYTGAPIDGAMVKYRVVRQPKLPAWWGYFWHRGGMSFDVSASQEIDNGKIKTGADGKFEIEFTAKPDNSIPKESEPTFIYTISADVTDSAGETRSDQKSIRLGYTAMEAAMDAGDWLDAGKAVKISVDTKTLDGKFVKAEGQVEIFELKQPEKPVKAELNNEYNWWWYEEPQQTSNKDIELSGNVNTSDWKMWPAGSSVTKKPFNSDGTNSVNLEFNLKAGVYKAILTSNDRFGNKVKAILPILVFDEKATKFNVKAPSYYVVNSPSVEVGDKFRAILATGYEKGPILVEILHDNENIKTYWVQPDITQHLIEVPVLEEYRGGFSVMTTFVKENRLYTNSTAVYVPWSNKKFDIKFETFRSKLQPGQEETWTIKVKGPGAEMKAAEFLAALYDESLDAFVPHSFNTFDGVFKRDYSNVSQRYSNVTLNFQNWFNTMNNYSSYSDYSYKNFMSEIVSNYYGYEYGRHRMYKKSKGVSYDGEADGMMLQSAMAPPAPAAMKSMAKEESLAEGGMALDEAKSDRTMAEAMPNAGAVPGEPKPAAGKKPDLSKVSARQNLNETAFFYPALTSNADGIVNITFKMPEALTKWKFLGYAHGVDLENGLIEEHAVTQKDLMVQPNPPRFLREGDVLEFTAKVTNMTDKEVNGSIRLNIMEPASDKSIDAKFKNDKTDYDFVIPAKQSKSLSWQLNVPDKIEIIKYKVVASTGDKSDGEEGLLPILSKRIIVYESIPLPIRGPQEKKFKFEKLAASAKSDTLEHKLFTVQMTSNPSWYAVQALPYLMEFPHECSEQTFNRLYANSLAKFIADSDPKIRKVFDVWKKVQPDALKSNLEKNEQLKSVMLIESPWVLDAKSETQAKNNVGILFDDNRLKNELESTYDKLKNMQLSDGSWPWFPGGRGCSYITLYITNGFGRLKNLKVANVKQDLALKALDHLDGWINKVYQDILKYGRKHDNHISYDIALYLYCRSFYLSEKPIPAGSKEAVDYFLGNAKNYWLDVNSRMSQAHLALAFNRFADKEMAQKIMKSIKERSQTNEEMGMFWGETELSWWWYRAPIETQALMVEAFAEIMNDEKAVEDCKVWLLKQKQTQNWKTTTATADSIYALLLRGDNLLASDALVEVTVGGKKVEPEKVEAGTGFYEKRYDGAAVKPEFGEITVKKVDKGIAWGGAHWQYMEDMSKITPHTQNPLTLKKTLFVKRDSKKGPTIEPVSGALEVGDLLTVRIELRTDRDMEFVHMKDQRGSGLEPTNVLSQYKYQDGLAYYESTKDTATHFFIDYLPKGTYVFEYTLRVQHKGKYQTGMANIECMYAPEFSSHSESFVLEVK
ncbi:MAG: alpha-2-macroglobulin family protein [Candidatus Wallbacteria bacterium]